MAPLQMFSKPRAGAARYWAVARFELCALLAASCAFAAALAFFFSSWKPMDRGGAGLVSSRAPADLGGAQFAAAPNIAPGLLAQPLFPSAPPAAEMTIAEPLPPPKEPQHAPKASSFALRGTAALPSGSLAIVKTQAGRSMRLREGDVIEEWRVLKIAKTQITLGHGAARQTYTLRPMKRAASARRVRPTHSRPAAPAPTPSANETAQGRTKALSFQRSTLFDGADK